MPTIVWKQIKQPAKWAGSCNEEWDGTFTFNPPVPIADGLTRDRRIYLEAYCGSEKIGHIEATTSIYQINHDTTWNWEWKTFKGSKGLDFWKPDAGLDGMRKKVEDSFLKWCAKAGLK